MNVPVLVNGDITDLAAAREALQLSGAHGVMIGRGAQGQPWLVGQIGAALADMQPSATPGRSELIAIISEQYEDMLTDYGTAVGLRAARKHLDWYVQAAGIVLDKPTRTRLLNSDDPANVLTTISEIFAETWQAAA